MKNGVDETPALEPEPLVTIDRLILDLLARDPALRIGDARELLDRIEEVRRELHLEWTPQDAHAWWAAHVPEMLAPKPQLVL